MAGITGDFPRLDFLIGDFEKLASGRYRQPLARRLAEAAQGEIRKEFSHEIDPYGNPWKALQRPSKKRGGPSSKILQDTRRLRNSFTTASAISADTGGFTIGTNVEYAAAHNWGATIAPHSRRIVLNFSRSGRFAKAARAKTSQRVHATWATGIHIPRRQIIPEGSLGPVWFEAFKKETLAFIKDTFKNL